jgi:hypothetical protein
MVGFTREILGRLDGGRADGELDRLLFGGDCVSEDVLEGIIAAGDGAPTHPRRWGVVCRADGGLCLFGDWVAEDEDILK